jgi:putative RNA 2'-phosphotransferase
VISKRLSYVRYHRPDAIGITLDAAGWVDVVDLLRRFDLPEGVLTREGLERIVAQSDQHRFACCADGTRIRTCQERATDVAVGGRRGKPIIRCVHTAGMRKGGLQFYRSTNDVWLTAHVPPDYVELESMTQ